MKKKVRYRVDFKEILRNYWENAEESLYKLLRNLFIKHEKKFLLKFFIIFEKIVRFE